MKIKISIIMPSLNVAEYIPECIESVINQTLREIEIICIDAGSTDGTCEILKQYSTEDPRIKLIHSDVKSYGYQINLGIQQSEGKYIQIVETDDFIKAEMDETLYWVAENNDLDYVKADYDSFTSVGMGKYLFRTMKLSGSEFDLYGKVINPSNNLYLYANDYNVWKGIYRKSFLVENGIWMNESRGAAFQDIGFSDQVLACAERAMYIDKSFYRYRMDRDEASTNSVHGLEYSYNEFKRELEIPEIRRKFKYIEGIYAHMLQSFLGEFEKVICAVDYNLESEHIEPYMKWFFENLNLDIIDSCFEDQRLDYRELFLNPNKYVGELKEKNRKNQVYEQQCIEFMKRGPAVVFGAGVRGNAALQFLLVNGIDVKAICDNNEKLWDTTKIGIQILKPEKCIAMYRNAIYLVANKKHAQDMVQQLLMKKVDEDKIWVW